MHMLIPEACSSIMHSLGNTPSIHNEVISYGSSTLDALGKGKGFSGTTHMKWAINTELIIWVITKTKLQL